MESLSIVRAGLSFIIIVIGLWILFRLFWRSAFKSFFEALKVYTEEQNKKGVKKCKNQEGQSESKLGNP